LHIVPIDYAADRTRLLFLTAEGSKVLGVTMNDDVAVDVDEISGRRFDLSRPWTHARVDAPED
jgi:nitroimidazol reductase NimA-like FMN-containing flavoprotein (pyridoxamine 5'-phosphate oxidase superfamily)